MHCVNLSYLLLTRWHKFDAANEPHLTHQLQ